jgi:hypothetical protein
MSEFDRAAPALSQALLKADALSNSLIVCSSGVAVQSSHLPQPQTSYSFSQADVHPAEEESKLSDAVTFNSAPSAQRMEISREDDYASSFLFIQDQPALCITGTASGNTYEYRPRWKPVSTFLSEVALTIGGVTIERVRSDVSKILSKHHERVGYSSEISDGADGDTEEERLEMQQQGQRQVRRFHRIPFGSARQGFPLASLTSHALVVECSVRPLKECIEVDVYDGSGDYAGTLNAADIADTSSFSFGSATDNVALKIATGGRKVAAVAATDADLKAAADFRASDANLVMMPALRTHVLCRLESNSLLALSRTSSVASDSGTIAGQGPLNFSFIAPADPAPMQKDFAATAVADSQVIVADSDLWSNTPLAGLILTVESTDASVDLSDEDCEPFSAFDLMANNKCIMRQYPEFNLTPAGSMSKKPLPRVIGGKRLYMLSFESVSEAEKGPADPVSGVFAVSAATHPRLIAQRVAGAPSMKVTITKLCTNQWSLADGSFVLQSAYA